MKDTKTMPKFGLMVNPSLDLVKHMKEIRKNGFDFAELTIEPPNAMPEKIRKNLKEIRKTASLFPHPMVGHTAWWLDLGTEYELVRRASIEEFKKAIDACQILGIEYMNIHGIIFGMYVEKKMSRIVLRNFAASLKELRRYGEKKNVKIMLENVPEGKETRTFKSFKYIVDKSGVFVHFDIAHAFIVGGTKEVESYMKFGGRIRHIHIHDNDGTGDQHLPLGKGKIDFPAVIGMLKEIEYDRTITFEVFTSMKDAAQSKEKFRKMWMR